MIVFEHTVSAVWLWMAIAVAIAAVMFSFRRHLAPDLFAGVMTLLRLLFICVLALCLFMPQRRHVVSHIVKPRFVVALDTSRSMAMSLSPDVQDRWTVAQRVLHDPWTTVVGAQSEVDLYPFSTKTGAKLALREAEHLTPDGPSTSIRGALGRLIQIYRGQDVAGLLLLTDGLDTEEPDEAWARERWDWPIYTLAHEPPPAEEAKVETNLRVDTVNTARRVLVGWTTDLRAMVSGQGTRGNAASAQLLRDGKVLQETPVWIPDRGGAQEVSFQLTHPETGVFMYTVLVPPFPGESQTNDNSYTLSVNVVDAKNRLLYVEGAPRWESKYLLRILRESNQITPVCFLRGLEGKFIAAGPRSDMTPDMTEAQLALLKIVILGDLDAEELGAQRAQNLLKFVESGGSLALLGGSKAWGPAGFSKGPLAKLLPLKQQGEKPMEGNFPAVLTAAGRNHPVFGGDAGLWRNLPPLLSVFPASALSAGAESLLAASTSAGEITAVAVQPYGQGKVAAILTDSLWRWKLSPDPGNAKPYERFWSQLLSWLSPSETGKKTEQRLEVFADKEELRLGEEVQIGARLTGDGDSPNAAAVVRCEITGPDGRRLPFSMVRQNVATPSGKAFPGFAVKYTAQQAGTHTAKAVTELAGKGMSSDPVSFFVKAFTAESAPKPAAVDLLKALARNSGGRFFRDPAEMNRTLASLKMRVREEKATTYSSLWQKSSTIVCLLGLLSLEWALRKWRNMP